MRHIIFILAALLIGLTGTQGQTVPNGSFENWEPSGNYEVPVGWEANHEDDIERCTKSTDSYEGEFALNIIPSTNYSWGDDCRSFLEAGFNLEENLGNSQSLFFYIKVLKSEFNQWDSLWVHVGASAYSGDEVVWSDALTIYEEIPEYTLLEFPIDAPEADSIRLGVTGGARNFPGDGCYLYSDTWIDYVHIAENCQAINEVSASACESHDWFGETYEESGEYEHTITNEAGCDSIISLDLTIGEPTETTTEYTSCGNYNWNGTIYSESGVYSQELTSSTGCDSIVTLDLTVNQSTQSTQQITACDEYLWNGTSYTESGEYYYLTENSAGCDSIVTLDLEIEEVNSSVTSDGTTLQAETEDASYQWLDCENDFAVIEGATDQSFTVVDGSGEFALAITQNSCTDTTTCFAISSVGFESIVDSDPIQLYPNPARDHFIIQFQNPLKSPVQFRLFDITGKRIKMDYPSFKKEEITINTSHLPAGVYIYELTNDEWSEQGKIIVR